MRIGLWGLAAACALLTGCTSPETICKARVGEMFTWTASYAQCVAVERQRQGNALAAAAGAMAGNMGQMMTQTPPPPPPAPTMGSVAPLPEPPKTTECRIPPGGTVVRCTEY